VFSRYLLQMRQANLGWLRSACGRGISWGGWGRSLPLLRRRRLALPTDCKQSDFGQQINIW